MESPMLWDLLIAESTKAIMVSNEATYMKEIDGVSIDKHQSPEGRHFIARGDNSVTPDTNEHLAPKGRHFIARGDDSVTPDTNEHLAPKGRHFIARGAAQRNPGNQVHTTIKPRRGDIRTKG